MLCKTVCIAKIGNGCVLGIGSCTARLCGNCRCSGWKEYTAKLCRKLRIVRKENENLTFVTLPPIQDWISQIQCILRISSSHTRSNVSSMAAHHRFFFLLSDGVDGSASGAISYFEVPSLSLLIISIGLEASPGGGGGLDPADHMTQGILTTGWDGDGVGQYLGCIICWAGVGFLTIRGGAGSPLN